MELFLEQAENEDEQWLKDMDNPKEFARNFDQESLMGDEEDSAELLDSNKMVRAKDFYGEDGEEFDDESNPEEQFEE